MSQLKPFHFSYQVAHTIALICFCSGSIFAATIGSNTEVNGPLGRKIDDFLTNLSNFGYSGTMSVVKAEKVIISKGYGLANEQQKIPNTAETIFDVGSFAKQFTAVVILQLDSKHKLALTDPISKYLNGVPDDKHAITIEQLLSHTSGMDAEFPLPDPYGVYYEEVGRDEAVRRILEVPLVDEPGKSYNYSNIGYVLLAAIAEKSSGEPFRTYLRTKLFEPAGMHHTGFWGKSLPPVNDSLIAHAYDETHETADPHKWSDTTWFDLGGGEVVSTVGDLYNWSLALKNNTLILPAAFANMTTPRLGDYGFGCFVRKTPRGTTVIEHGGDNLGFGAKLAWYKDEDAVLIDLTNRSNQVFGVHHVADRIVPQIVFGAKEYHMFANDEFEFPPKCDSLSSTAIQGIIGSYKLDTGGTLIIQENNSGCEIGAIGQDAINAIADASDAEFDRRARLTDIITQIESGALKGDTNAVRVEWLREGAPVSEYCSALVRDLANIAKESGQIDTIRILGTVPGAFPVGVLHTVVRVECANGNQDFQFNWLNDRINGVSGAPAVIARTPLKQGMSKNLVGWSIIWFKGFMLIPSFSEDKYTVSSITIQHRNRTITARRITT